MSDAGHGQPKHYSLVLWPGGYGAGKHINGAGVRIQRSPLTDLTGLIEALPVVAG